MIRHVRLTSTLAAHTLRECLRRALPYVVVLAVFGVGVASRLFIGFSFGAGAREAANLCISATFLAGFALAVLLGTGLVRRDLERGTFGWLLSKPLSVWTYLVGRFLGLAAATVLVGLGVGALVAAASALLRHDSEPFLATAFAGSVRALLPLLILDAAALAISAVASRVVGPLALVALFLAGSLHGASGAGFVLPDFGVFALEAGAAPGWGALLLYGAVYSLIFLLVAFIVLSPRTHLRGESG